MKKKIPTYDVPEYKPNQPKMKKLLGAFIRTVSGKNKTGEAIHGVLDLLPIPNQALAKIAGYFAAGDVREAKDELSKLLTIRNVAALLGCIAFLTGLITIDDLSGLIELFK